jgi:hypothetical protein
VRGTAGWAFAAVLALVGCAGSAATSRRQPTTSAVVRAQATHEYPSPPPPRQQETGGSSTPTGAISAFASAYINWNAQTVSEDMRVLAGRSIGEARSAMQLAAAQTSDDYELQRGGISNQGTVEAVAPLPGASDQYVVVTRELTTATATTAYQGLQPAWHVAIAMVVELAQGEWVVSAWQPQS